MKANVRGVRARLYHASDLFVLPALASAAEVHLGRLTFDSRELYPHVGATRGKPWASWFWGMIERRYIRRADRVFTVNDSIADRLAETYRIDRPVLCRTCRSQGDPVAHRLICGITLGFPTTRSSFSPRVTSSRGADSKRRSAR